VTKVQKYTPIFVILVILLAVGYALIPFEFAQGVECEAPLFGAGAKTEEPVGFIQPEQDCLAKGRSRLIVSAMIALAAAVAGTAAVALKPVSQQCLWGSHDDCPAWWPNLLSESGESGFGCQCSCHGGTY
jgi:hypothetical protein